MPSPASSDPVPVPRPHAPGRLVTPGLVDQHCHGYGGTDFATAGPEAVRTALAALAGRGVTRVVASVPTMPASEMLAAVRRLAPLVRSGDLAGIHLEGPFLSPARCGAHPPADLLAPGTGASRALVHALLEAGAQGGTDPGSGGGNAITAMTYAPELDGAAGLEAALLAAGVSPSPGHTDATADQFDDALDRLAGAPGPPAVTHLFNAMAGFHHRRPGPVPGALRAAAGGLLRLELIADGRHVDPAVVRDVIALVPDAVCVVSDASAATGAAPGRHRLGRVDLDSAPGSAPRLAASGTLASGSVSLDRALGLLLEWGVARDAAVRSVTATPARGLPPGRRDSGWVVWDAPGVPGDVVLPAGHPLARGR
ncbi:amidohydrolase family protein [Micrococcus sp. TA1]|uniref:amidohydrolase family protein n=1 Tax=Micrococcus sp. TA1 TaxID=681627 RepID=UPI001610C48E|nr:amidohydrolase family protein [Micrococcus sp. TA1]MBB5748375.1 N-acetylglucosamine-6-phosphate deacetylase [Micrococcus sp. TA1]